MNEEDKEAEFIFSNVKEGWNTWKNTLGKTFYLVKPYYILPLFALVLMRYQALTTSLSSSVFGEVPILKSWFTGVVSSFNINKHANQPIK